MRAGPLLKCLWGLSLILLALWIYSALWPRQLAADASRYFDPLTLERSLRRAKLSYLNSGLASVASLAVLYALYRWSSKGPLLSHLVGAQFGPGRAALLGLGLGAGAALLFSLTGLPFGVYGYYLDRAFGLTPMRLPVYLLDYAKNTAFSVLQYAASGMFAAWAIVRFPRAWHWALTGSFLAASLLLNYLYPVVIAPAFNTFRPLEEGPALQDVRELSAAAGMHVDRVLVMEASAKTSRANAYFAGVGRTKQVVLYDTLLQSHSREETRLVIAHELAHWRFGHLMKSVLLSSAAVLVSLLAFRSAILRSVSGAALSGGMHVLRNPTPLAIERLLVLMFVFATLTGFVLNPASAYVSRRHERQADAYALALTGDAQAFTGSQVRLATTNLADVQPPPFIYWYAATHPSTLERILSAAR
ncbi:MAG: M48 family metallopeptidase [Bacillota bacterium]